MVKKILAVIAAAAILLSCSCAFAQNLDDMDNNQLQEYLERLEIIRQIRQLENEIANSNPQEENRADGNEEAASALQALQEKYDQLLAKTEEREMALAAREMELGDIQAQLIQKENDLHAAQSALKTKEEEQALLQLQLAEQADRLAAMQTVLENQKAEMLAYQQRIDAMIGVRTKIIQDLSQALKTAGINVHPDETTGDIVVTGNYLSFDSNSSTIKEEGRAWLARFLPVYLDVLMRPEYADYVGEIIIEGHTDDQGSYMANLKLSQNRALSVMEFCLTELNLNSQQAAQVQEMFTARGRSFSDPIRNADGSVDRDASRRVEFKFRLKDAEMIQEMNKILSTLE